jgi:hypothetical protein
MVRTGSVSGKKERDEIGCDLAGSTTTQPLRCAVCVLSLCEKDKYYILLGPNGHVTPRAGTQLKGCWLLVGLGLEESPRVSVFRPCVLSVWKPRRVQQTCSILTVE